MKHMNIFFITIVLFFSIENYSFAQIAGITAASCGYLSRKGIYCFGGETSSTKLPATTVYFLDTVKNNGSLTKDLANKWTSISSNKNNVIIQSMDYPQYIVLGDTATMLINGGQNYGGMTVASKTVGYNAENNSWIAYPDFTESPFAARQIFGGSSVYVPEYGAGFYGGREANKDPNWTVNGQNISGYDSNISGVRYIGYTKLTFFDVRKSNPWFEFPVQNNVPSTYIESHRSIFDPINNKIFFIGGGYFEPGRGFIYESLKSATTFDVNSGTWSTQSLEGMIPSARSLHTMTLLPSTNRDVLLYGGELGVTNCVDYLFTLNLDTYIWKQHLISDIASTELIRTGHSAALVNNTLFIVFGKNQLREIISSVIILNVTNPSHITYVDTYIDPNQMSSSNNNNLEPNSSSSPGSTSGSNSNSSSGSNSSSNSNSELSTGALIGIAVGSTIAGVVIISIILYFLYKRYKIKKKSQVEIPEMENVNWEELEKNYEVASSKSLKTSDHPSPSSNNTIYVTNSTGDSNQSTRPNVNSSLERPDSNVKYLYQKPDGG